MGVCALFAGIKRVVVFLYNKSFYRRQQIFELITAAAEKHLKL
jgi:hypothetical protein